MKLFIAGGPIAWSS